MKILVIFTGGTIGSTTKGKWTSLDGGTNFALIEGYLDNHSENIELVTRSPYSILSENITAAQFNLLTHSVLEALGEDFDGIIVTHGTDTLQYSAAALSAALPDLKVPVVLVSSNYPLSYEATNGHINFEAAVEYIKQGKAPCVVAAYKNSRDSFVTYHLGDRIYSHLENDDALYSLGLDPYGKYEKGVITLYDEAPAPAGQNKEVTLVENPGITVITATPADGYAYALEGVKAVILRPYHSGTLNTASPALKDFCQKAKEQGVELYTLSAGLEADYDSTSVFAQYGIKVLPRTTFPTAYMKLWQEISEKE